MTFIAFSFPDVAPWQPLQVVGSGLADEGAPPPQPGGAAPGTPRSPVQTWEGSRCERNGWLSFSVVWQVAAAAGRWLNCP
jgi:hypothetical protein